MLKAGFMRRSMILFLVMSMIVGPLLPVASALSCQIQIINLDFPSVVTAGQKIEVKTQLTVTCTTSTIDIAGRVDLIDLGSNKTLSTSGIHVGFIGAPKQTTNFTISNAAQAPVTPGIWRLKLDMVLFAGGETVATAERTFQIQVGQLPQATTTTSPKVTATQTSTSVSSEGLSVDTFGLVGVVVAVVLIASVLVLMKRKKPSTATKVKQEVVREIPKVKPTVSPEKNISTGYADLDNVLAGGLPVGYAVLVVSPPCDERDLLFQKIIDSGLSTGRSIFFVSRDLGRTQDLAGRYKDHFYAFSPQADKVATGLPNLFKISGVQNLNDVNISLTKAMEPFVKENPNKIIIMDILSDVLLEHKALTTRKWLDDFVGKRKAEGFTILGTLNPLIASKQESQTIIDIFDGIIEIYEKELRERARRFLVVKKMYGRKYIETELMLDKDKLF